MAPLSPRAAGSTLARLRLVVPLLAVPLLAPVPAAYAQPSAAHPLGAMHLAGVAGGGELDRYLRVLQLVGRASAYPWSIRGFSADEVERILPASATGHPWHPGRPSQRSGRIEPTGLHAGLAYNTAFPYGLGTGPVWRGRGATGWLGGGAGYRVSHLSLTIQPVAFWAENRAFPLFDNGREDRTRFGDPLEPLNIDYPQAFGDASYARLDPGESTLRLHGAGVAAGVSSAAQVWGAAIVHNLLLGSNAGGFPHLFLGTESPRDVGIAHLHARYTLGRLAQSQYSAVSDDSAARLGSGIVVVLTPKGGSGLEIGASRFVHDRWPERLGLDALRAPFEGLFAGSALGGGTGDPDATPVNSLASVFARLLVPRAGAEVFLEYARNDRAHDLRDVLVQPDHNSAYVVGFQRAWALDSASRIVAVRGEVVNARPTHLARVRGQARLYQHTGLLQGHTHRGRLLGTPAALGGSGHTLAVDLYDHAGRASLAWDRVVRMQELGESAPPGRIDVQHALTASVLRFVGTLAVDGSLGVIYEMDRDFAEDRVNLSIAVGVSRQRVPR